MPFSFKSKEPDESGLHLLSTGVIAGCGFVVITALLPIALPDIPFSDPLEITVREEFSSLQVRAYNPSTIEYRVPHDSLDRPVYNLRAFENDSLANKQLRWCGHQASYRPLPAKSAIEFEVPRDRARDNTVIVTLDYRTQWGSHSREAQSDPIRVARAHRTKASQHSNPRSEVQD